MYIFIYRTNKATASVERYATDYKMTHKNRGHALIFNHESFRDFDVPPRPGTNVDRDNLLQTLEKLHFLVKVYNDKTWAQIRSEIENIASSDHSENDCILIAVLSHGDGDGIWARDCTYKLEKLCSFFTGDRCPSLAGKPKLFVIQACQGPQYDRGIEMNSNIQTDSDASMNYKIPVQSDFLIIRSSMPGYVSWRNKTDGSWFIQALCEQLRTNGTRYDIMRLITFVNQKVAIDFESNSSEPHLNRLKQIPCTTFMLTRVLTFNEK